MIVAAETAQQVSVAEQASNRSPNASMTIMDRRSRESVGDFQITIDFVWNRFQKTVLRDILNFGLAREVNAEVRTCRKASVYDGAYDVR